MPKSTSELIADAQLAFTNLSNRLQILEDQLTSQTALQDENTLLKATLDNLTAQMNMAGVQS